MPRSRLARCRLTRTLHSRRPALAAAAVVTAAGLIVAGCGGSGGSPAAKSPTSTGVSLSQPAPPKATCGTSHTAIGVPVIVEVEKGSVSCATALHLQASYASLVRSGDVPGNGGGAPVKVDGWTCQGTDTTTTLQTGEASQCHQGGTEIIAILKTQGSSSSPGSAG
jgi:hypothetical protein